MLSGLSGFNIRLFLNILIAMHNKLSYNSNYKYYKFHDYCEVKLGYIIDNIQ